MLCLWGYESVPWLPKGGLQRQFHVLRQLFWHESASEQVDSGCLSHIFPGLWRL